MSERQKLLYVNRLEEWEAELETNKHGMREYAERSISLIKDEIKRLWPEYRFKEKMK